MSFRPIFCYWLPLKDMVVGGGRGQSKGHRRHHHRGVEIRLDEVSPIVIRPFYAVRGKSFVGRTLYSYRHVPHRLVTFVMARQNSSTGALLYT